MEVTKLILKRLVKNIKKQDWFSVLLELCIVVLGIYLGFQATQWQAEREAKHAESQLLMRLLEDLTNLENENHRIIGHYNVQLEKYNKALEFTRSDDSWKLGHKAWRKQLQPLMGYADPVVDLPVYQEIVATAQFSNIKNQLFRSELTRFAHKLGNTEDSNKAFLTLYGPAYQSVFDHLTERKEFPDDIANDKEQKRKQLIRDLHTMRNTVFLLRTFTKSITEQASTLRTQLEQDSVKPDSA